MFIDARLHLRELEGRAVDRLDRAEPALYEQTRDTEFPYGQQSGRTVSAEARDAEGRSPGTLPCFRPPWASLTAIDAATGEFVWRVPLSINDNLPDGKKNVGSPGYGGPMVTAGGLEDRPIAPAASLTGILELTIILTRYQEVR